MQIAPVVPVRKRLAEIRYQTHQPDLDKALLMLFCTTILVILQLSKTKHLLYLLGYMWKRQHLQIAIQAILTMGDNDIYLRFFNNAGVLNLQYGYRRTGGFVGGIVAVTSANYLNTWKLVSLTRNSSGTMQLFVDGVLASSTVNSTPIAYGTSNRIFRIGNVWTGDQQFEGRIQDVFYYNDAISLTPFLCSAVPPTSNTVSWKSFCV
jgi:hypothetical protein